MDSHRLIQNSPSEEVVPALSTSKYTNIVTNPCSLVCYIVCGYLQTIHLLVPGVYLPDARCLSRRPGVSVPDVRFLCFVAGKQTDDLIGRRGAGAGRDRYVLSVVVSEET